MRLDRRTILGTILAVGLVAVLSAAMVPLRDHLSVASAGLVLVVPVVAAVVVGGLAAGVVAVGAGFVAYDLVFIPPYGTLAVGAAQNWVALVVYVVVLVLVAAVVADQRHARAEARRREHQTRRLFELSEALSADQPDLAQRIVDMVVHAFHPRWVALLVPGDDGLQVAATAGTDVSLSEVASVAGDAGTPVHLLAEPGGSSHSQQPVAVALVTGDIPAGMLAIAPAPADRHDRQLLATFANQAAIAVERSRLHHQALRTEVLEVQDQARRALLRTVSHDLRTPLATIKASLSELRESGKHLSGEDRAELLGLAEAQADRLDRLVANLLDINRIEAGTLAVHRDAVPVHDLLAEALATLGNPPVAADVAADVPPVEADHTLIGQVLVNLLDNALRFSPGAVEVHARAQGDDVVVSVVDRGPGVARGTRLDAFRLRAPAGPEPAGTVRTGTGDGAAAVPGPATATDPATAAATGTGLVTAAATGSGTATGTGTATAAATGGNPTTGSAGASSRRTSHASRSASPATGEAAAGPVRSGLGLTIAHAFVAAHGRTLILEDNPGGGARFSFALPAAPVDDGSVGTERDSTAGRAHPHGPSGRAEARAEAAAEAAVSDEQPHASSVRLGSIAGAQRPGTSAPACEAGSS